MITAVLKGGLGNQLFQIAATINLAIENKTSFAFDARSWGDRGGAAKTFQARSPTFYEHSVYKKIPFTDLSKHKFIHMYHEPHFHYRKIDFKDHLILNGYFQSEKYFKDHADIIRKAFAVNFNKEEFLKKYNLKKEEVVAVHVRRGEYLNDSDHHPPCTTEYFKKAMAHFENVKFLFISDDIQWCKDNFEGHLYSTNTTDIEDFNDLIMCDHNIISNSTFSWWGAWLNNSPNKKVIAPAIWFGPGHSSFGTQDLLPESWKQI